MEVPGQTFSFSQPIIWILMSKAILDYANQVRYRLQLIVINHQKPPSFYQTCHSKSTTCHFFTCQTWWVLKISYSSAAFWNRWTLDLHFGPGNAELWTEISAQKHTKFAAIYGAQISTADSSTKPSGLPALGLSWHVCSIGLDQPMTDLWILFLKQYIWSHEQIPPLTQEKGNQKSTSRGTVFVQSMSNLGAAIGIPCYFRPNLNPQILVWNNIESLWQPLHWILVGHQCPLDIGRSPQHQSVLVIGDNCSYSAMTNEAYGTRLYKSKEYFAVMRFRLLPNIFITRQIQEYWCPITRRDIATDFMLLKTMVSTNLVNLIVIKKGHIQILNK